MRKRVLALILTIIFMFSLINAGFQTGAASDFPFRDVDESDWFYKDVKKVYEQNLMIGKYDGIFAPRDSTTRAEALMLMSRLSGEDISGMRSYCAKFSDVSADAWYADCVGWGAKHGIVNGYEDNTFLPDRAVYRDETAALINRFAKHMNLLLPVNPLVDRFADEYSIQEWAEEDVEALRNAGVFEGDQYGKFNSKSVLLRSEEAALASRLADLFSADPMHAVFDNILNLTATDGDEIKLNFGSPDTVTEENFNKLILRNQLALNSEKYRLVMDESELDTLRTKSGYSNMATGSRFHTTLTISIENVRTKERTESKKIKFVLQKKENFNPDDGPIYEYKLLLDGTCEIVNYINESNWNYLNIPESLNGIKVSAIGDEAFAESKNLKNIIIPEGVETIGNRAFALCTSLEKIVIPNSVKNIKRGAFYYCSKLSQVSLPTGLKRIPDYMFYMCGSLTHINNPGSIVEIGAHAFNNTKLVSFIFNPGLERIGDYSFEGCNITEVVLPSSCVRLGGWAFYNCSFINKVRLNKELTHVGSGIFYNCPSVKEVEYEGSFKDWENLKTRMAITEGVSLICSN